MSLRVPRYPVVKNYKIGRSEKLNRGGLSEGRGLERVRGKERCKRGFYSELSDVRKGTTVLGSGGVQTGGGKRGRARGRTEGPSGGPEVTRRERGTEHFQRGCKVASRGLAHQTCKDQLRGKSGDEAMISE